MLVMQRDPDNREIAVRLKQVGVCVRVGVRSRQQAAGSARAAWDRAA
eukprot:COSAG01_NODE_5538_length_4199_cov_2.920244_3_plen_47_part_00